MTDAERDRVARLGRTVMPIASPDRDFARALRALPPDAVLTPGQANRLAELWRRYRNQYR